MGMRNLAQLPPLHHARHFQSGIHPLLSFPDMRHRASIFALQNLSHKKPQRKVIHSEQAGRWEGAWENV